MLLHLWPSKIDFDLHTDTLMSRLVFGFGLYIVPVSDFCFHPCFIYKFHVIFSGIVSVAGEVFTVKIFDSPGQVSEILIFFSIIESHI